MASLSPKTTLSSQEEQQHQSFQPSPRTTYVYFEVTKPSSSCSNYDENKRGSQAVLL